MTAVRSDLYIALTNAGVPQEQANKLAAADAKLNVEATLIATLEAIAKARKWQQTLDDGCREMMAKDKPVLNADRDWPKTKVLTLYACIERGGGPGHRYRIEQVLNSIEYHPGDYLTPDEVRVLCDAPGWQVSILAERQPLPPR